MMKPEKISPVLSLAFLFSMIATQAEDNGKRKRKNLACQVKLQPTWKVTRKSQLAQHVESEHQRCQRIPLQKGLANVEIQFLYLQLASWLLSDLPICLQELHKVIDN